MFMSTYRAFAAGLAITCLLELCLAPVDVSAQTDFDRATARALAEEGYRALKAQQFDIAQDRFWRADALVHAPTFVVDDGRALIGLGRFVEAQERFELVLREGIAANAPGAWKKSFSDAAQLLEEVKPKIAWLTISVPNIANAQVKVDGQLIPRAAFDVKRATNPGTRKIEATADGYESQELKVDLGEGAQQTLTITMKQLTSPVSSKVEAAPLAAQQAPIHSEKSSPKLAYMAFGVGGLGIVVGAVTGFMALRKRSDLTSVCHSSACPPSSQSDIDAYHSLGLVSGLGFGLGLGAATTGYVLLQMGGPPSQKATALNLRLRLRVDPNRIGLEGTFQ
jgi:hypothetical protein